MAGWELRGQLRAGADAQLAVDPLEICLHGMDADEQGVGHLSVGAPGGDQLRHPRLGRGQVHRGGGPSADPRQLGTRPFRPRRGAEPLEDLQGLRERVPSLTLPLRPALHRSPSPTASDPARREGAGDRADGRPHRLRQMQPWRSPRAANTSARHLAPVAMAHARSRLRPASSKGARSASASSSRPRATSASTSSGTTRK